MAKKRVVVTGLGSLTPIGNDTNTYWQKLIAGVSGAAPITRFDASLHKTRFACELKGYDPEDYFDRKEIKKLDVCSQYALVAAKEAIEDAGLALDKLDRRRIGVIWGTGIGGIQSIQEEVTSFVEGNMVPRFNAFFIPKMIANMSAGYISIKYGLQGPTYVTISACASSSHALINAAHAIQLDLADIVVSGGSEAAITPIALGGFNVIKALSERNDDPQTASRPFDKNRDGFVVGEGAGGLIVESYEHAKARGAKIYAEIIGTAMTGEAYHITAPHPEGQGAIFVMQQALRQAGLEPAAIEYINAHGTSTTMGDSSEAKAIKEVFQEHAAQINISSTKSMTGHLLGAAGAIEAIATILAIHKGIIPPTINQFERDETLDPALNFTPNQACQRPISMGLSNTFGFGGHNTSIIFKKWVD